MDLSLRDLADRSGVSAPMLSQVERGETSPTLAVAERIAFGLELSLSQLLRLDETEGVSVVRADGEPLPGLYAAGEVAGFGGGGMHGYRALEGTFLGGCLFSGRTAGRAAASTLGG